MLEKNINIRAADYRFTDKRNVYLASSGGKKKATEIVELYRLAMDKLDFREEDLKSRNAKIIEDFLDFLTKCDLLK